MTNVLPPPAQVAGKHAPLFEAFYRQLDPAGKGIIAAPEGAMFLKKSGLSDAILSKIWDLSDPQGKGYLDKAGLFVSLKLVSLAQNGREVDIKSVLSDAPEPQMGERPSLNAVTTVVDSAAVWTLTVAEMEKYTGLFRTLEAGGKVPGAKAKGVMIESKLPVDVLGKIWDMADVDKDGALDLTEFVTCMGLLGKALADGGRVPTTLPKLPVVPASAATAVTVNSVLPPATPPLIGGPPPPMPAPPTTTTILPPKPQPPPIVPLAPLTPPVTNSPIPAATVPLVAPPQQQQQQLPWVVSQEELAKYSVLFTSTDKDRDGYVSGLEIRDVFLQSGIPQPVLAHIWNLCDTDQTGKLSLEQFALAMYFINKKLAGIEPPVSLLPNMVPPSLRSASGIPPPAQPSIPVETNPEFELISKEIRELALEREAMENEIAAKETEKKIKSGEMRSLQTELDTLAATLKQLENQKSVAGAKLGELAAQVDSLRTQADEQEEVLKVKEGEVNEKLREYNSMNEEEASMEAEMKESQETIEKLTVSLQDAQLAIVQAKAKVSNLTELKETMENLLTKFNEVIENGNVYSITEPELVDLGGELTELIGEPEKEVNANFDSNAVNNNTTFDNDPFADNANDMFVSSSQPAATGFVEVEEDPFAALHAPPPLSSSSPWSHPDPFAPVAAPPASIKHDFSPGKDPFGHEPFSLPEESPALPPKKTPGKTPPPRPAPPKNAPARPPPPKIQSTPAPPAQQNFADPFGQGDPFGGNSNEVDGGFADFANFEAKFTAMSSSSSNASPWGPSATSTTTTSSSRSATSSVWKVTTGGESSSLGFGAAPLDFTEDPFKNYRYEDPFALADPFTSLAGDPFSQDPQEQQQQQSNSHFRSHGAKTILNNNINNNNNITTSSHMNNNNHHQAASKNAHNKNGLIM